MKSIPVWRGVSNYEYCQSGCKINHRKLNYLLETLHSRRPVLVCKSGSIKYAFCVKLSSQCVICKYLIYPLFINTLVEEPKSNVKYPLAVMTKLLYKNSSTKLGQGAI